MNYNRMLALSFGAIGIAAIPVIILFRVSILWIILQLIVWVGHGCLLYYQKRDHNIVPLPLHSESTLLLSEPSPMYHACVDDACYEELYKKLQLYFKKEKPFLKPGINVADVANHLSSNRGYLSRLLNEKLNKNFNQFVNEYRIKEAQRLVAEKGPMALSELCKRVGFTSMASFTVAFKLYTGMTPGEWCRKQRLLH